MSTPTGSDQRRFQLFNIERNPQSVSFSYKSEESLPLAKPSTSMLRCHTYILVGGGHTSDDMASGLPQYPESIPREVRFVAPSFLMERTQCSTSDMEFELVVGQFEATIPCTLQDGQIDVEQQFDRAAPPSALFLRCWRKGTAVLEKHTICVAFIPALPSLLPALQHGEVPEVVLFRLRAILLFLRDGMEPLDETCRQLAGIVRFEATQGDEPGTPRSKLQFYLPFPTRQDDPEHWLFRQFLRDTSDDSESEASTEKAEDDQTENMDVEGAPINVEWADEDDDGEGEGMEQSEAGPPAGPPPQVDSDVVDGAVLQPATAFSFEGSDKRVMVVNGARVCMSCETLDDLEWSVPGQAVPPISSVNFDDHDTPAYWTCIDFGVESLVGDRKLREWLYALPHPDDPIAQPE